MRIRVVLDECINEGTRREPIGEARSDQVRGKRSVHKLHIIAAIREVQVQVIVWL